jgi:hypothetical protein
MQSAKFASLLDVSHRQHNMHRTTLLSIPYALEYCSSCSNIGFSADRNAYTLNAL